MRKMATGMAGGLAMLALACAPVAAEDAARETDTQASASAPATAEARDRLDLTGFDRIEVGGIYTLDVEVGPAFGIELSGSSYMVQMARARVENGVLHLDHEENTQCRGRDRCGAVRARITLPALAGLSISGVSEDSRVAGIDAERFTLDLEGVGELVLAGRCGTLDLQVQGVGDVDAEALRCADVSARIEGVGDVDVYASRSIDANVEAMGDLTVHGSPTEVTQQSGRMAEITIR